MKRNNLFIEYLVALLTSGILLFVSKIAQNNGELVRALILAVTTNIVLIIFFIGSIVSINNFVKRSNEKRK